MVNTEGDTWACSLGPYDYDDYIEYYVFAQDDYVEPNLTIENNSGANYDFTVDPSDTTGPVISDISHSPSSPTDVDTITVSCTVEDEDNGVASVTLYYRIDGGSWSSISMINTESTTWSVDIGAFAYDEDIEYYITATDDYVAPNTSTEDNGGAYQLWKDIVYI